MHRAYAFIVDFMEMSDEVNNVIDLNLLTKINILEYVVARDLND